MHGGQADRKTGGKKTAGEAGTGRRPRPPEPEYPVFVGSFGDDHRYRLVWLRGIGWEPLEREEFEPRVREVFPDIDFDDPEQVRWADRPQEWPAWHPGEA